MEAPLILEPHWLVIFVIAAFIAGYIDAIAGGGGMLQVPVLLLGGLPPVAALATNKIISMTGTLVVTAKYALNRLIIWKYVAVAAPPCLIASAVGSQLAIITPPWILKTVIFICIVVALFISIGVKPKVNDSQTGSDKPLKPFIGWISSIGLYDGFSGPGTGTFMVLANNRNLGVDFVSSVAIAKPLNLTTNIGALAVFLAAGQIIWMAAIPMLIANSVGGWIGGHFAIRNGSQFVWKFLVSVLLIMFTVNIGMMII